MGSIVVPRRLGAFVVVIAAVAAALVAVPRPAAAAGPTDHVLYWNNVLLKTYRQIGGGPTRLARAGAMVHGAIYDAANSALCTDGQAECLGQPWVLKVANVIDFNTVIDYAAFTTLTGLYGNRINFQPDLDAAQVGVPDSPERQAAIAAGQQIGNAVLANRANDGSATDPPYNPPVVPGAWRPTGSGPAVAPGWGNVRPFALTGGAQFRPPLPAGQSTYPGVLTNAAYTTNYNEVKDVGAANSTTRGADRTQAAWFWANDLDGTYKPPGQLFEHTRIVSAQQGLTVDQNAKMFAYVAFAMADAAIVAWDAKYNTPIDLWRPETAIHEAANDGNPSTAPDASWQPLSADRNGAHFSPPFPAYVSGHATFAGAWAATMRDWFGRDDIAFTATTDDPHAVGVTRPFATFSAAARENADSRIWLGVHYRWDADQGVTAGGNAGGYVVTHIVGPNSSPIELAYTHQIDASSSHECDDLGRRLLREHRWLHYRCQWTERFISYVLFVS
jgi:hypothetical protein